MRKVNHTKIIAILTLGIFVQATTKAQLNNHHKNYIDIGLVGGSQRISPMAGVYGSAGFFFMFKGRPASIDFRAKEVYIGSEPEQQGTLITITYRASIVKGLFVGIGGAHGHQIDLKEFLTHPVSAIGGNNKHILHSSGFNAEVGYNFNSFIKNKYIGIYPTVHIGYTHLVMSHHHSLQNLTLNAGFRIGFKKF